MNMLRIQPADNVAVALTDIAAGEVEYTDEIKNTIYEDMLEQAKDAAYEAAVTQWVSEATVKTFEKAMK